MLFDIGILISNAADKLIMQVIGAMRGIEKIIAFLEENLISGQTKHRGLKHNKGCFVFPLTLLLKLTWLSVMYGGEEFLMQSMVSWIPR